MKGNITINMDLLVEFLANQGILVEKESDEQTDMLDNVVATLPCRGGNWNLTERFMGKLLTMFPQGEQWIMNELFQMEAWLQGHRKKTRKGMPSFVINWLKHCNRGSENPMDGYVTDAKTLADVLPD